MSYRIEISADSLAELGGKLLAAAAQFQTVAAEQTHTSVTYSAPEVVEEINPVAVAEPEIVEEAPAPETTSAISYEDIRAYVLRIAEAKGRDGAVAFLNSFGVTNAKDIDPAKYGDVAAAAEEIL